MRVKITRHSERLDRVLSLRLITWFFYFGYHWADSPLTPNGYSMARRAGINMASESGFDPKIIYTSPYNRTMSTATELRSSFCQAQLVIEPLLAEYQPLYAHAIGLYPHGIPTTANGRHTPYSYPETYTSFESRARFILYDIMDRSKCDIIIVTHAEVIKYCINYLQSLYPDLNLDVESVPYLTTLSFDYDCDTKTINPATVEIWKLPDVIEEE